MKAEDAACEGDRIENAKDAERRAAAAYRVLQAIRLPAEAADLPLCADLFGLRAGGDRGAWALEGRGSGCGSNLQVPSVSSRRLRSGPAARAQGRPGTSVRLTSCCPLRYILAITTVYGSDEAISTKMRVYLREPGQLRTGIDRLWKMVMEDSRPSAAAAAAMRRGGDARSGVNGEIADPTGSARMSLRPQRGRREFGWYHVSADSRPMADGSLFAFPYHSAPLRYGR